VGTVKLHLHQVSKKLGINTRVELVMRADEIAAR
jgi:DNA-binding NarL/FixJ family response regulator